MNRLNRRRLNGRRLVRPGRPAAATAAAAPAAPPPLETPEENPRSGAETEVALPSVRLGDAVPQREQEISIDLSDLDAQPAPPRRMEFNCPCGAKLIATRETYDKHSRCGMCQTVLLVNLVYDPEGRCHEIVPFRVDPSHPL